MLVGAAPRILGALRRGPSILSPAQVQPVYEINSAGGLRAGGVAPSTAQG